MVTKTDQKQVSPEAWQKLLALVEAAYGERNPQKHRAAAQQAIELGLSDHASPILAIMLAEALCQETEESIITAVNPRTWGRPNKTTLKQTLAPWQLQHLERCQNCKKFYKEILPSALTLVKSSDKA